MICKNKWHTVIPASENNDGDGILFYSDFYSHILFIEHVCNKKYLTLFNLNYSFFTSTIQTLTRPKTSVNQMFSPAPWTRSNCLPNRTKKNGPRAFPLPRFVWQTACPRRQQRQHRQDVLLRRKTRASSLRLDRPGRRSARSRAFHRSRVSAGRFGLALVVQNELLAVITNAGLRETSINEKTSESEKSNNTLKSARKISKAHF